MIICKKSKVSYNNYKSINNLKIVPPKTISQSIIKLSDHLVDPSTKLKSGTLGKDNVTSNKWKTGKIYNEIHAYNQYTGCDIFFSQKNLDGFEGLRVHTGMKLGEKQMEDVVKRGDLL